MSSKDKTLQELKNKLDYDVWFNDHMKWKLPDDARIIIMNSQCCRENTYPRSSVRR